MPANTHQPISLASLREKYTIVRIDSIKHILVIYARKDAASYKIVTRKDSLPCTPIRVGEAYPLVVFAGVKEFNGMSLPPHVTGTSYDGVPVNFEKEWGNNIFYAVNLKGLCLQF
jgi:hypothetical protein